MQTPSLADRFLGCFLGLTIGDALGSPVEGMSPDMIFQFFGDIPDLCNVPTDRRLHYTDDTQMMIGVAQTLLEQGRIVEEDLVGRFVANLQPSRGYGPGAIRVLQAMSEGGDWRHLTTNMFPGGSYGNGAAMRVAPVGLVFRDDLDRVWERGPVVGIAHACSSAGNRRGAVVGNFGRLAGSSPDVRFGFAICRTASPGNDRRVSLAVVDRSRTDRR